MNIPPTPPRRHAYGACEPVARRLFAEDTASPTPGQTAGHIWRQIHRILDVPSPDAAGLVADLLRRYDLPAGTALTRLLQAAPGLSATRRAQQVEWEELVARGREEVGRQMTEGAASGGRTPAPAGARR